MRFPADRNNAPASPRAPLWGGGALKPQHLQRADQYAEERLAFLLDALMHDTWGFSELRIDTAGITGGTLRIASAVGRFPSGLAFDARNSLGPVERALPTSFAGRGEMSAFLAVAVAGRDAPNVTADPSSPGAVRFVSAGTEDPELAPALRILFDDEELPANMERLPLARLRRRGMNVEVDKTFLPPMLRMLGGTEVTSRIDAVMTLLQKRQKALTGARRGTPASMDPARYPQLHTLSAINRALAGLTLTNLRGDPARLYDKLSTLLGALESLAGRHALIPEFSHDVPAPAFLQVLERLSAVVPTVAADPFVKIPLHRRDAQTFETRESESAVFRRRLLLVATGVNTHGLSTSLPTLAKIAGPTHIHLVVQSAVAGVRLAVEFDPPPALATDAADVCFRLDQRSDYWDDIVKTGSLFVFVNQAPAELSLTLYAVDPS